MTSTKSDLDAKTAFCKCLEDRGFTTEIRPAPADIRAEKDGVEWFFEIKKTSQDKDYFGAATSTEWEQAFKDPAHYRFVICQKLPDDSFHFIELTPAEMMEYSTIPPFKVFFNVPLDGRKKESERQIQGPAPHGRSVQSSQRHVQELERVSGGSDSESRGPTLEVLIKWLFLNILRLYKENSVTPLYI